MAITSPTSSTTNTTASQQTLDNLLAKLGVTKNTTTGSTTTTNKSSLDQSDFLKLMTSQLANQDPFAPQDNNQMIAQMAQFSTVTGITQLNTTMTNMATSLGENRIATAATFVGRTVLVPGSTALTDSTGGISGAIDLPSDATALTVQISDSTGQIVKTIDLGANVSGLVGFQWDGNDASGKPVGKSSYTVGATMVSGGKTTAAATDVYAPVTEVPLTTSATDAQTLKVGGIGTVAMSSVRAIKY